MAGGSTVAIDINNVSKDFRLPHLRKNSVKSVFTGLFESSNKKIETQQALKDISFQINEGEFFGIVGRNGSGKSTLLKMLAGIYQPTKGNIAVNGKLVPFIELGVGFNPDLSGRENVYLNGSLLGFSVSEVDAMYDDIVAFAELEKFMDQKLKNYSSGMQVRLAFSMAIRADADILLIDEVLAVGDADFQRKCFDYFKKLKKMKKTVVFVSHDMNAVREYCDKAVMIEKSQIIATGNAEQIAQKYTKMFIDQTDSTDGKGKNKKRWGNGQAKVEKFSVKPEKLTNRKESLQLDAVVSSKKSTQNLIIGFAIKAADGSTLTGTNTLTEQLPTGKWKAGEKKTISWSLPNIFSDGMYYIDIAVLEENGIEVCDWLEDATTFKSLDDKRIPYSIYPDIKTEVK